MADTCIISDAETDWRPRIEDYRDKLIGILELGDRSIYVLDFRGINKYTGNNLSK